MIVSCGNKPVLAEPSQSSADMLRAQGEHIPKRRQVERDSQRIVAGQPGPFHAREQLQKQMSETLIRVSQTHIHQVLRQERAPDRGYPYERCAEARVARQDLVKSLD